MRVSGESAGIVIGLGLATSVVVLSGCAYLNGDALWLSNGQKGVFLHQSFSTLGDVEYSFQEDNLPFCFHMLGSHEFGHVAHSMGSLDFSKGGYVSRCSLLRFSIRKTNPNVYVEFFMSNGVMQVAGVSAQGGHIELRKGPLPNDAAPINVNERWREIVLGKLVCITIWNSGCSIQIHRLGEYGIVYNYFFPSKDGECTILCISEIKNMRWFHWPSL